MLNANPSPTSLPTVRPSSRPSEAPNSLTWPPSQSCHPTHAPSTHAPLVPTSRPSTAIPTRMPTIQIMYTDHLLIELAGASSVSVTSSSAAAFTAPICDHLVINRARCVLVSVATSPATAANTDMVVEINLFPNFYLANASLFSAMAFVNDQSANGYAAQAFPIPSFASSVFASKIVNASTINAYPHTCALTRGYSLSWAVDSSNQFIRGLLRISGSSWVSGGVVLDATKLMVSSPRNLVFLFNPADGKV